MGKGKGKAAGAAMIRYSAFLRPDQLARLRAVQDEHGVPVSVQIRRAIDAVLGAKKGGRP